MSHFTKIKTRIFDRAILVDAIKDLNYTILSTDKIQGFGATKTAELVVDVNSRYTVGFTQNEDRSYDMVGDWWGIKTETGKSHEKILNEITQRYAYKKVLVEVKRQGFMVAEEKVMEDDSIKLVVRKWQ